MKTICHLPRVLLFAILTGLTLSSGPAAASPEVLNMATTTSTENSGLLEYLLPPFEQATGYRVHVVAVGTGKALRLGQRGDADVVLVHARPAEDQFVAAGYGVDRHDVMYNDFVVVGPQQDPAELGKATSAADAFKRLATSKTGFVSRADDSGTNKKEMRIWKRAAVAPHGKWYVEAGQGMGKVLQMASQLQAYTLTDRGTWLAMQDKLELKLIYQGDPMLFNPYGIIAVNPQRHPSINFQGAQALIYWITSPAAQKRIASYQRNGEQLFHPNAR